MSMLNDLFQDNQELLFYLLLAVAVLLTRIPIIGKYFRGINTMIHEGGHAFMTLLVSGELIAVNLFADNSGTTVTRAKNRFLQGLISFSGYPASNIVALLLLYMLSRGYYIYILFILTSITLLLMVLSIRNAYGLFWAGTFAVINLLLIYYNSPPALFLASTFFSLVILTDGLFSTIVLLVLSIRTPQKAGDASNLQKFFKLPALIWSLIFLAISGYLTYLAILHYFPDPANILNL